MDTNVYPSLDLEPNPDIFKAVAHGGLLQFQLPFRCAGVILDNCVASCVPSRPHVYPGSSWGFRC